MTSLADRLSAALAGRYRIERELGSGGMATVYLARDEKHDRKVAIKVLREELSASLGKERFLREIRIAASLQHPHVLPLHDSGEAAGLLFYVMPFVDGESLRQRLLRQGELPVADAMRILRDIADALSAAHKVGIVHRDLKPENVMLSGRHALVTDFGVAKALSEATGRQSLTTTGIALGTPTYMAPEQATADPHVDARADIYALGVVAYELLTGRPPFASASPQQVLAAHVTEQALPVSQHRPALSPQVASLVMRCLEKKPSDRWQSAEELIPQLEGALTPSGGMHPTSATTSVSAPARDARRSRGLTIVATVVVLAVMAFAGMKLAARGGGSAVKTLAVLPFDAGADTSIAYIADGITEGLTTALAKVPGIEVRPHYSSKAMAGRALADAGASLRVESIVQATMRRTGSVLRVSVQLLNVANESVIWGDNFDASERDPLAIQDSVVASVARELKVALTPATQAAIEPRRSTNPDVRDLILRGRFLEDQFTEASLTNAKSLYERAIALDSTSAEAWAGVANCWTALADDWIAPHVAYPPAKVAALRALKLDSASAASHAALGSIALFYERDYALADREFRRALEIDSMTVAAALWYPYALRSMGLRDSAAAMSRRMIRRHPLSYSVSSQLARVLDEAGQPREAEAACFRIDTLKLGTSDECSMRLYWRSKRYPEALVAARRAFDRDPTPTRQAMLAYGQALAGDREAARAALAVVLEIAKRRYVREETVAEVYLALGERAAALDWLDRLLASSGAALSGLGYRPEWDSLRDEPRFQSVLRRSTR